MPVPSSRQVYSVEKGRVRLQARAAAVEMHFAELGRHKAAALKTQRRRGVVVALVEVASA